MIRGAAAVGGLVVLLAALTACTPNDVNPALSWLDGQDGVAEASVVVDRTDLFGTSGVLRGELEPGLDGARLDLLVERVAAYARDHDSVELRLGVADVDFVVDDGVAAARRLWTELRELDGVVAALADGQEGVRVHVMRPAFAATVDALADLDAVVEVEGFRDAEAERLDRADDDYGPPARNSGSLQVVRGSACEPGAAGWDRVLRTAGDDRIAEGAVDACGPYDLTYDDAVDLSAVATEWAQEQERAPEPVPALAVKENGAAPHEISVTPGDASMFPVVAGFEMPGTPAVRYVLPGDGTLLVTSWDPAPASDLLAILAASPLAERLTSIQLEGDVSGPVGGESVTASGTIAEIAPLIAEAEALFPLDPSIYVVAIDAASVRIDLYAPPGGDPDMAAAARAIHASPIWANRELVVGYLNGEVIVRDGVAAIGADYTDREPYDAFVAAWNGVASP
jgi:hypothetical protein